MRAPDDARARSGLATVRSGRRQRSRRARATPASTIPPTRTGAADAHPARAHAICSCRRLSRTRFDALVPRCCRAGSGAARTPTVVTVDGCSTFSRRVSGRSAYLALLIEHPPVLPRLAHLMGASALGRRLSDAASDPARRAARQPRAARRARLGRSGARARMRSSPRAPTTPSARWTRCATSSTRRRFACWRRTWPGG